MPNKTVPEKAIRDLMGLGPKSEAQLADVGIFTIEQFLAADPFDLYAQLKARHTSTSLNFLYAMIGAQENIPWQTIAQKRKTEILLRLDDMGIAP